jgi:dTDP-D-glucose 4,6-dehydratase
MQITNLEKVDIYNQIVAIKLMDSNNIDTSINFATNFHSDRSTLGSATSVGKNNLGSFLMLEAARNVLPTYKGLTDVTLLFHLIPINDVLSSLVPFGLAFSETITYSPYSTYTATKASRKHLVSAFYHTYGLSKTLTISSSVYNDYQFLENFIPMIILNTLVKKTIQFYADKKQIRDWLYAEDYYEAIRIVLLVSGACEFFNIGGDYQPTNLEIVKAIFIHIEELRSDSVFMSYNYFNITSPIILVKTAGKSWKSTNYPGNLTAHLNMTKRMAGRKYCSGITQTRNGLMQSRDMTKAMIVKAKTIPSEGQNERHYSGRW